MTWDRLFEQYIGRQLRLLPCAWVLPEITYGPKSSRRTVDWIVVLSEVVLLVEVKSAIPAEPVRLGTLDAADAVLRKLGKAVASPTETHKPATRRPIPTEIPRTKRHTPVHLLCVLKVRRTAGQQRRCA